MSSRKKLHVELVIDFTINKVVKVFTEGWGASTFAVRYTEKHGLNFGDIGIIKKSVEGTSESFRIKDQRFYKIHK